MLQPPSCGMGKLRNVPPGIGPPVNRVSIRRQGVAATNCCAWEKMASTDKDCVIVTVQERVQMQSPFQPPKTHPCPGVAFNVTGVFGGYVWLQVPGQCMKPSVLATLP